MNTTELIQERENLWKNNQGTVTYGIDISLALVSGVNPQELEKRFKVPIGKLEKAAQMFPELKAEIAVTRYLQEISENLNEFQAELKNMQLTGMLADKRSSFCDMGTRKAKLRLNKLSKEGVPMAKILRMALEIEDLNITAKGAPYYYRHKIYSQKSSKICELADLCQENNLIYGIQRTCNYSTSYVIYFEIPDAGQISFHTNTVLKDWPVYQGEWDGLRNSTMGKIEKAVLKLFENNPPAGKGKTSRQRENNGAPTP